MARESALDVIRDHQVTRVIHLAAVVGAAGDADVPETIRVNGSTTVDLLASARQAGVERVVMMSSKGVYGDIPLRSSRDAGFDESDLRNSPLSAYGISKAVAEWACNAAAHTYQQDVVYIRAASTVGPGKGAQHGPTATPSRMVESAFAGDEARFPHVRLAIGDGYNFHGRDHNLHGVLSYARARRDFGYEPTFPFPQWVDDYVAELARR
jgi:nucleoside-diphosphate-sugar epimerase